MIRTQDPGRSWTRNFLCGHVTGRLFPPGSTREQAFLWVRSRDTVCQGLSTQRQCVWKVVLKICAYFTNTYIHFKNSIKVRIYILSRHVDLQYDQHLRITCSAVVCPLRIDAYLHSQDPLRV